MNENNKLDKIHIRDLSLQCIIGINNNERVEKQEVIINITLYVDMKKACISDNIDDAVDYKKVKQSVVSLVESSSFFSRGMSHILQEALHRLVIEIITSFNLIIPSLSISFHIHTINPRPFLKFSFYYF